MNSWKQKIEKRLRFIYGDTLPENLILDIKRLVLANKGQCKFNPEFWSEHDVALITYGDTLLENKEKPLQVLNSFAINYLKDSFSIIHILPFFPYSSDDGFSVIDFKKVNPELGSWKEINYLTTHYRLMADLVINHASSKSEWFQNFLQQKGEGLDYFIESSPEIDLSKVTRPRSTPLLTKFETTAGEKYVWTTFSDDQIDLNFENPKVLLRFIEILLFYLNQGISIIRLDAIAFLWKEIGTNCLHHDKTHEVVKLLRDVVELSHPGTILITETNVPNKENLSYFGNNDEAHMVYQFSLPPLLLHALFSGNSKYLTQWAQSIPELPANCTFFNFTASHDGIGVRPLEGLLPEHEKNSLFSAIKANGGHISMKRNTDGTESPYELNITYFDSLKRSLKGEDNFQMQRFICSQTIALAMKGLPAIYIHSLLASPNYNTGVKNTSRARTINREQLNYSQLVKELQNDTQRAQAFAELMRIISVRKTQKAFHPSAHQEILDLGSAFFAVYRSDTHGNNILSISNMTDNNRNLPNVLINEKLTYDLLSAQEIAPESCVINPYQTFWLTAK